MVCWFSSGLIPQLLDEVFEETLCSVWFSCRYSQRLPTKFARFLPSYLSPRPGAAARSDLYRTSYLGRFCGSAVPRGGMLDFEESVPREVSERGASQRFQVGFQAYSIDDHILCKTLAMKVGHSKTVELITSNLK